ncbi:carbohydrate ABC transporter permease [Vallitalea sediminicola]
MGNFKRNIFDYIIYAIIILICILCLYPFIYVLSSSLSSPDAVTSAKVWFFPVDFNFDAYKKIFEDQQILIGYANAFYYTILGTLVNIILTISGAYPLSKRRLRGRKLMTILITFTMWFNAGMIPFYLNLRDLNLLDKRITLIIAFGCSAFYVILLRTNFQSIPDEIEESAKIDGANDLTILFKIFLPLAKPAIATVGLYYAVSRWNGYFWAMLILKDPKKIPLQVILKKMIVEMDISEEAMQGADMMLSLSKETLIFATIIIGVIPMLIIYPFIQKYFEKGSMVGSVKG